MPAAHTATDLPSLETAIITAVRAITPTYQPQQDSGWVHVEDNRSIPTSMTVRVYDVRWGQLQDAGPSIFGGGTLFRQSVDCSLFTHYRGAPSQILGQMVNEDSNDLFHALHNNTEQRGGANEIAGLVAFDHDGWTVEGDPTEQTISHNFTIHYMRSRS